MSPLHLNAWLLFVVVLLASARTFRLLAFDTILQTPRDYLEVYVFPHSKFLRDGFYCPNCAGFWYCLLWAASALAWHDTWPWQLAAFAFAGNYAAAVLNGVYDVVHESAEDLLNES